MWHGVYLKSAKKSEDGCLFCKKRALSSFVRKEGSLQQNNRLKQYLNLAQPYY